MKTMYIAGYKDAAHSDEMKVTDFAGVMKVVGLLYDIHIDYWWGEHGNKEEADAWRKEKADVMEQTHEDADGIHDLKVIFNDECVPFGIFQDGKLVWFSFGGHYNDFEETEPLDKLPDYVPKEI